MTGTERSPRKNPAPVTVSHVVDFYRRYPGEAVTFHTRVEVREPVPGFTLRITLPPGLILEDYRALADPGGALPWITLDDGTQNVIWKVEGKVEAPARFEYQVAARVASTQHRFGSGLPSAQAQGTPQDLVLESRAVVSSEAAGEALDSETVAVAVSAQGRYLKHLPAIYRDDELMGRFLMLFESFWAPIEQQIDSLFLYFDPRLTPPELLPWLASWIDLVLDERWPEERRRLVLRSAAALYRKRGTRQGLEEYLEIYTGAKAQIVEHRAHNFRLGSEARLGPAIALGRGNVPHTFTVLLRLPPVSLVGEEKEHAWHRERRRKIEAIIEAEKPAHTSYALHIEEA